MARFLFVVLLVVSKSAFADADSIGLLQSSISTALDQISTSLSGICVKWLGGFLVLQMIWTQIQGMLNGAEFERAWGKWAVGFFWAGFCLYIYENGADFIRSIANYLLNLAAGLTGEPFTPTYPITVGLASAANLLSAFDKGQSILSSLNPFPSIMMGLVALVILAMCTVIAFRIFMIAVETKIVIALSPISFALMGLNALRDQGFTPLKYLIAMGYRVMIMGAILAAMTWYSGALVTVFQNLPASNSPSVWPPIWEAAIGYSLLGALAWNSNSIAAHLASGSSAMTTSDLGGPAAIAAAVGGAVGAAVGSVLPSGALGKIAQSMSDWTRGSGVGIGNASETGRGALDMALQKPEGANLSIGGSSGQGDSQPKTENPKGEAQPEFKGVSNIPSEAAKPRDAARDEAREARRQARASGSGDTTGIGGTQDSTNNAAPASPRGRGLLDHIGNIHDKASRNQAPAVHVSLNTHHGE